LHVGRRGFPVVDSLDDPNDPPVLLRGDRKLVHTGSSEDIFFGALGDLAGTLYGLGAGAYNLILGSLEARVTIQDLLNGAHLESDEVSEILDAERIIRGTVNFLQERLSDLATFDGSEDLYEIE
jgi:hypothetical protein